MRSRKQPNPDRYSVDYYPPETFYPAEEDCDFFRMVTKPPGKNHIHVVTADEVIDRLHQLPEWMLDTLNVVQLSTVTRKMQTFPCYGLQWNTTVYLYSMHNSLVEHFHKAPPATFFNETKMYGAKWKQLGVRWELHWKPSTIKDYYLNNILIHEMGHLIDDRNQSTVDRERYAEAFAIEYGYLKSTRPARRRHRRRHKGK